MSTVLISRLARRTLHHSRARFIATTPRLAKAAINPAPAAASPLPPPPVAEPDVPVNDTSNSPESAAPGNPTKGRKITRKSRRSLNVFPNHLVLNVPSRGATFLQDTVARQLATDVGADLLIFDVHDFIALAQSDDSQGNNYFLLPSDTVMTLLPSMTNTNSGSSAVLAIRPSVDAKSEEYDSEHEAIMGILEQIDNKSVEEKSSETKEADPSGDAPKAVTEMTARYSSAFERMLQQTGKDKQSTPKLIYLRDYGDMHDLPCSLMLKALMLAVEHMKQKGHRIVVLGGYSPSLTSKHINYKLALDEDEIPLTTTMKTISIAPPLHDKTLLDAWEAQMKEDAAKRIGEINAKRILAILQQKNVTGMQGAALVTELSKLEGIQENVWSGSEIERHVTFAIGYALRHQKSTVDLADLEAANHVIRKSISHRSQVDRLLDRQRIRLATDGSLDMNELKKHCDEYEQRFLSCIVDPSKVHGSFADIRAPSATIETLQTLITLPLVRPDLFRRGILKNNFIPGILLFGPPGTGKTMLAKAVAKESGSRMLEVQASDIYEMYLGEGEKNVKALFSLARKLSPCVVFIDEMDSLMSRRRSDSTSNAHREIINQFMVEWDGLSSDNQGVLIAGCTNRPFDLDEAVLRRMPRRILVDLPKEEDRAEILKILLRDEQLDHTSEAELARATEHYSGSDLKNLCVTAALKAAQKEARTQQAQRLGKSHFDEALKLVRPSTSEDMESLVEIRKWAAKYGDGGTQRKKQTIGFSW
ncbi:P-loop containing nucleoside triphosphate hydrolase protein [Fennellomyces sp. T-0311]|nr:P-loop containing nucleoside triphosphate hydrolase protein [Fennellomyces sp. T-0311]